MTEVQAKELGFNELIYVDSLRLNTSQAAQQGKHDEGNSFRPPLTKGIAERNTFPVPLTKKEILEVEGFDPPTPRMLSVCSILLPKRLLRLVVGCTN